MKCGRTYLFSIHCPPSSITSDWRFEERVLMVVESSQNKFEFWQYIVNLHKCCFTCMYFYYLMYIADWTYSRFGLYNVGNIETCKLYVYDSSGSFFPNSCFCIILNLKCGSPDPMYFSVTHYIWSWQVIGFLLCCVVSNWGKSWLAWLCCITCGA